MKNFLSKHKTKIIIIAIFLIIVGSIIGVSYYKYLKDKNIQNMYYVIFITYNPISGQIMPIEFSYYERFDTNNGIIHLIGLSPDGIKVYKEIDRRYVIMIHIIDIPQIIQLK